MRLYSLTFAFISGFDFETISYDIKNKRISPTNRNKLKSEIIKQIRDEAKSIADLVKN